MRSRIYKKTQNFSKLLDPGKTKDRIAKWIVLMLFTYTWSQAHKTVLLRRMGAYSWECIEDCHIPIRPGVFNPVSCQEQQRQWYWDSQNPRRTAGLWQQAPGDSPSTPQTDADIFIFTMDRNKDIKPWELDYRLKQSSKSTKVTDWMYECLKFDNVVLCLTMMALRLRSHSVMFDVWHRPDLVMAPALGE